MSSLGPTSREGKPWSAFSLGGVGQGPRTGKCGAHRATISGGLHDTSSVRRELIPAPIEITSFGPSLGRMFEGSKRHGGMPGRPLPKARFQSPASRGAMNSRVPGRYPPFGSRNLLPGRAAPAGTAAAAWSNSHCRLMGRSRRKPPEAAFRNSTQMTCLDRSNPGMAAASCSRGDGSRGSPPRNSADRL